MGVGGVWYDDGNIFWRKVMGWIESVTKEGFQLAVREAMRPDMAKLEDRMGDVEQRVARLEGTIEGNARAQDASVRAFESSIRAMLSDFKVDLLTRQLENKKGNGG